MTQDPAHKHPFDGKEKTDSFAHPAPQMLIVFNPTAGRRRAALLWRVLDVLVANGVRLDLMETNHAGHAAALAREAVARRAIGAARPAEAARRREAQSPRWVPSFAGPGGRESFVLGAQWMDSDRRSGDAATPGGRDGPNGRTFMAPKSRGVWGWRGGAKYRPASRGEGWA